MATSILKTLNFMLALLLVAAASVLTRTEAARDPFSILTSGCSTSKMVEDFFGGLSLGAIKQSGPSPGVGHQFTNSQTLGGIKNSGPSPGVGHSATTGTHE